MRQGKSRFERFLRRLRFQLVYIVSYLFVRLYFPTRVKRDPELKRMKGPMIVIAPHQNFLDPFFLSLSVGFRHPPRFVTTDNVINPGISERFFKWISAIPIKQFATDTTAVRNILRALKDGDVVALFPEGERTLDGRHYRVRHTLLKIMNKGIAPIVFVSINGAHLSWPKWAKRMSRGRVEASSRVLFTAEEAKAATVDEIHDKIAALMDVDDFRWQFGEDGIDAETVYRGKGDYAHYPERAKSKGLDHYLHFCPMCETPFAMTIRDGRHLVCAACGTEMYPRDIGSIHIFTPKTSRHADENKSTVRRHKHKALNDVSNARIKPKTAPIEEKLAPASWYVGTLLDWHDRQYRNTHRMFADGVEIRSRKRVRKEDALEDLPEAFVGITRDKRAYTRPIGPDEADADTVRILDPEEDPFAAADTVELDVTGFVYALSKYPYVQFVCPSAGERFRFHIDNRAYAVMFADLIGNLRDD